MNLLTLPPLSPVFYRPNAEIVAPRLLGKVLVVQTAEGYTAGEIVEVEAYLGKEDPASHAYIGLRRRNQSMFASGGTCYVYLSYGINYCMNVVTGAEGDGQAVLLRAVTPRYGEDIMITRRGVGKGIANGPGKLTQAFGIRIDDDGRKFFESGFKIVDTGRRIQPHFIARSPRVGISKAKDLMLRFYVAFCPDVSRYRSL